MPWSRQRRRLSTETRSTQLCWKFWWVKKAKKWSKFQNYFKFLYLGSTFLKTTFSWTTRKTPENKNSRPWYRWTCKNFQKLRWNADSNERKTRNVDRKRSLRSRLGDKTINFSKFEKFKLIPKIKKFLNFRPNIL